MTSRRLPPGPGPIVILIRHADVSSDGGMDPPLNAAGAARAQELRHVLSDSGISAIFVTSLQRTRMTAQPLAGDLGLVPIIQNDPELIVEAISKLSGSAVVLVVGHSNTVPDLVQRLDGPTIPPIAATEFDRLLVLNNHRVLSLRYQ